MKKMILAVAAAAAMTATGCKVEDAVRFHNLEDISVSMAGGLRARAVVKVENTSGSNIRISDASFSVTDRTGNEIGRLWVEEEIVLPRRTTADITIPVKISFTDPIRALTLAIDIENTIAILNVSGEAVLKRGIFSHRVKVDNAKLSGILSNFESKDTQKFIKV